VEPRVETGARVPGTVLTARPERARRRRCTLWSDWLPRQHLDRRTLVRVFGADAPAIAAPDHTRGDHVRIRIPPPLRRRSTKTAVRAAGAEPKAERCTCSAPVICCRRAFRSGQSPELSGPSSSLPACNFNLARGTGPHCRDRDGSGRPGRLCTQRLRNRAASIGPCPCEPIDDHHPPCPVLPAQ
jgi:hypothetical protein